ncbi:uncharacterized protein [Ptychodera flava]|uniref:uncharacterized protein n=1 Tax=Ptychodera flava TaxID=63121 RepID=UPI00396A578B
MASRLLIVLALLCLFQSRGYSYAVDDSNDLVNSIDGHLGKPMKKETQVHVRGRKKASRSKLCLAKYGARYDHICADGLNCLPEFCVCDGFVNCWDGSDEYGCEKMPAAIDDGNKILALEAKVVRLKPYVDEDCSMYYSHAPYRCADGEPLCMKKSQICDGFQQCADRSDERDCGYGETDNSLCVKPNQTRVDSFESLKKQILEAHNYYRCLHGVAPLLWDKTLEKYGDYLARSNADIGRLEHSDFEQFGENIAMQALLGIERTTGYGFVKMFYDEIKFYDFKHPKFSYNTGHFTQLIWKDTKRIGCGSSLRYKKHWTHFYIACEYYPPGNEDEESKFAFNVVPPL